MGPIISGDKYTFGSLVSIESSRAVFVLESNQIPVQQRGLLMCSELFGTEEQLWIHTVCVGWINILELF